MNKLNKVAVFGMGKSGKAALQLALKHGSEAWAVNKGSVDNWYITEDLPRIIDKKYCASEDDFRERFPEMDEIIISPGIPLTHPALTLALQKNVPIISEIEFAWRDCKDIPVIAITGTNGKTTTTTMIAEALEKAGKSVFCGGNIGVPYCDLPLSKRKVDYAVIEVSSFQLETTKDFHPRIGVILNVFPNHSERYDRVEVYARAKFRLLNNMTSNDDLILGTENPFMDLIKDHKAKKHFFTKGQLPREFKLDLSGAKVKGEHNEANFFVAYKVLELLNIPNLPPLFQEFINDFKGVAHRLEFVLEVDGLKIYNDAKSTNMLATSTAIKAFKGNSEPLHLILGGKLRSEGDKVLPDLLPFKKEIATLFTIGDVTDRLHSELMGDFNVIKARDLAHVFQYAKEKKLKGNLVFSPAFPSFDQFKNYVDRGEKFKQWAREAFL
jgi:UDP-N-acetylmuramoylalanine--D-glutamate ligase